MALVARDIAEKDFITLRRGTNALEAAKIMNSKGIGFVVVSTNGSLEGIVTEWDYVSKVVAEGKNPVKVKLADIMSGNLVTVDAEKSLDEVARLMSVKRVRRVLVLWEDKLIGVITARTLLAQAEGIIESTSP